ncbi:class II aldolase/adducin family protein [Sphingomonas sp. MG17]|uniref:Class II aldolase/adducin family protein n=1 Tax=Sphingomonas tagetis TaxID=2949092 RepID=A0A9X2KMD0_9SPHN|nr:class II aldolase/adducin family protein [Sphingomonas tagetis]MCP3731351.1 class II aldolase/adducin family protein [Sphingomonas tagetis]
MNQVRNIRDAGPVPGGMSEEEWQVRCDLAACYQLIDLYGMADLMSTHISARVPGGEDHFLLHRYGLFFEEVTASSLIKVDVDGNIVAGEGIPNSGGFVIHSAIHMYRRDLQCVLHTHTTANNAIAMQKEGLLPLSQQAMMLRPFIGYHEYEGVADDLDERARIANNIGPDGRILVLRHHGALAVGQTVGEAFVWNYRFETACQYQVAGLSGGRELGALSNEAIAHAGEQGRWLLGPGGPGECGLEWPALLRKLERERGSSYRT